MRMERHRQEDEVMEDQAHFDDYAGVNDYSEAQGKIS